MKLYADELNLLNPDVELILACDLVATLCLLSLCTKCGSGEIFFVLVFMLRRSYVAFPWCLTLAGIRSSILSSEPLLPAMMSFLVVRMRPEAFKLSLFVLRNAGNTSLDSFLFCMRLAEVWCPRTGRLT